MHETGSSSTNSLDKFICSVAEQSFCHRGFLLGSPRTGWRDPNSQTTCLFKALYSTKEKVYKLRNFKASAIIAPPTATHATLPALIARELEIVGGGLSGDWVTLIAAHNSNTSTIIYKNKASELFYESRK